MSSPRPLQSHSLCILQRSSRMAINAGGPKGYIFHLNCGLLATPDTGPAISLIEDGEPKPQAEIPPAKKPHPVKAALGRLRRDLTSRIYLACGQPKQLNPLRYRADRLNRMAATLAAKSAAHAHSTEDADCVQQLRQSKRWNGHLLLTSHCPEAPALEKCNQLKAKHFSAPYYRHLTDTLLARDLAAFAAADAWIFPSPGAMEPYHETLPGFTALAAEKLIRFVPTGITDPVAPPPEAIAKRRIAPPDAVQICFVGRHESVKGYDLFCEAVLPLLESLPQLHVVCAGVGQLPPPSHPRWHELGRINDVQALLRASDLFVLPNRRTYYDLILLEALAAASPIVATATGGNRDVAGETDAIRLCEPTPDSLRTAIRTVCALPQNERAALSRAARACFEKHHTELAFARNYRAEVATLLSLLPSR